MKIIKEDDNIAQAEQTVEQRKQFEMEAMQKALEDFRKSSAYPYVMKFFKEQEEKIIREIEGIQNNEMKTVFLLPATKQREKIAEMSKRDIILTAILGSLKTIKGKL